MVNIKKKLVVLLTLVICFAGKAYAGFMVEPYAGFALAGSLEQKTTNPTLADYSGLEFGGRLGFSYLGFMGGATYNMASASDYDFKQLSSSATNSVKRTDLGVFVGFEFPIMLRVWGSYYLDSQLTAASNTGSSLFIDTTETWKGSGIGLGVGFTFLPFVSLNVEYKSFTFTEMDDTDTTPVTTKFTTDVVANEILVSVSLPLSF